MIARRVIFEGRVQGVGFRYTVKQLAMGFEIVGTVKNLADGTVELDLMGEEGEVEDFIREIVDESTLSHYIKDVHSTEIPLLDNTRGFTISA